jgi:hypothetical protein
VTCGLSVCACFTYLFISLPRRSLNTLKHRTYWTDSLFLSLQQLLRLLTASGCFYFWRDSPQWARASSFTRLLDHTQRRATPVRLLWTSDQLVADTSTWQHSQQTNIHAPGWIRTHYLSRRAAADLRFRPCGHWDRQPQLVGVLKHGHGNARCLA